MPAANRKLTKLIIGSNTNGTSMAAASPIEAPKPKAIPTNPPSAQSTTASVRNCKRTSRASAPMARRMPISRVRSVTDTSMMFMIPMPPTKRLIEAITATIAVSAPVAAPSA